MARRGDSVVGIDLGKHVFKAVALQRRTDSRFVLTNFALCKVPEIHLYSGRPGAGSEGSDQGAWQQWKRLRRRGFRCRLAPSYIIEQPNTPVELLRNALRLNGPAVSNQEWAKSSFSMSRPSIHRRPRTRPKSPKEAAPRCRQRVAARHRYLVGGVCCAPK